MMRIFTLLLSFFLICSVSMPAHARMVAPDAPKVTITLEHPPFARKGESLPLIITQNIIPHWHTYWINPGDSGEEMKIRWTLQSGVEAGDILYPVPERINYGPLVNFGHKDASQFITTLAIPEDLDGNNFKAEAVVSWLVCDEICIPEKQNISIDIPLLNKGDDDAAYQPAANEFATRFTVLKNEMPQYTGWNGSFFVTESPLYEDGAIGIAVELPQDIFKQAGENPAAVKFFPYDYGLVAHAAPAQQILVQKDGANALNLILPKGDLPSDSFETYQILLVINGNGYYIKTNATPATDTTSVTPAPNDPQDPAPDTATDGSENTSPISPSDAPNTTNLQATSPNTTPNAASDNPDATNAIDAPLNTAPAAQNSITDHSVDPARPTFTGFEKRLNNLVIRFVPAGTDPFFATFLLFAFLGGIILNLMPCVFPVLSMKALSVVKLADKSILRLWGNGLFYTLGVLFSFGVIATALLLLRRSGQEIGWGFQLQNPDVVIILSWLIFTVGLNLSGIFHISLGRAQGMGAGLATQPGLGGAFFTGMLATLVATPCTAAFMGTALGAALVLPATQALIIFLALGFGLAFPYLLICLIPPLVRLLPRPGSWMETFRQFLAFPMYATAIWLVWVAVRQVGDIGLLYALGGMLTLGFAVWLLRHSRDKSGNPRLLVKLLAFVFLVLPIAGLFYFGKLTSLLASPSAEPHIAASTVTGDDYNPMPITFDEAELNRLLRETNRPIFVNMTASWCVTCIYNEKMTLSTSEIQDWKRQQNLIYMKGDWTNQDEHITRYLSSFGRSGVPLYVFYGVPDETNTRPAPVILPQILSTSAMTALMP